MNYINFSFKGGAADFVRRNRRVRAISLILEKLDFVVDVQADTVTGRIHKYGCDLLLEKLDFVGRLLLYTRQMDMLMKDEESVTVVARDFLSGNYSLD
jgi:pyruvate,water dikinase